MQHVSGAHGWAFPVLSLAVLRRRTYTPRHARLDPARTWESREFQGPQRVSLADRQFALAQMGASR